MAGTPHDDELEDQGEIIMGPSALGMEEETKYEQPTVSVFINDRPSLGAGTLTLTSHRILWKSDSAPENALSLPWKTILMHAVSRDTTYFPHPCIYCQVDGKTELPSLGAEVSGEEEDESSGSESATRDVRFVLTDPSYLGVLFTVFSECQALHPEEQADGEGEFMFNEDEVLQGALENGAAFRMPLPADVDMLTSGDQDDDRFADADEGDY